MRALIIPLALVSMAAQAAPLNDTGIDFCLDHTTNILIPVAASTTCTSAQGGQDARYGRDPAAQLGAGTKVGGGAKGFDFTKIANNGTTLPASAALGTGATDWACTYDNVTGLMWEVKVSDPSHLRYMNWGYSAALLDTSNAGPCLSSGRCKAEEFVADVNSTSLCGHSDWRMPTVDELSNLADLGIAYPDPSIDPTYFPNTPASVFWTSSLDAGESQSWWIVDFLTGDVRSAFCPISGSASYQVRLVRAGR